MVDISVLLFAMMNVAAFQENPATTKQTITNHPATHKTPSNTHITCLIYRELIVRAGIRKYNIHAQYNSLHVWCSAYVRKICFGTSISHAFRVFLSPPRITWTSRIKRKTTCVSWAQNTWVHRGWFWLLCLFETMAGICICPMEHVRNVGYVGVPNVFVYMVVFERVCCACELAMNDFAIWID